MVAIGKPQPRRLRIALVDLPTLVHLAVKQALDAQPDMVCVPSAPGIQADLVLTSIERMRALIGPSGTETGPFPIPVVGFDGNTVELFAVTRLRRVSGEQILEMIRDVARSGGHTWTEH